jgi:hypothetical protein
LRRIAMPEEKKQGTSRMQTPLTRIDMRRPEETAQKEERQSTDEPQPTEGDPLPEPGENPPDLAREERERILAIVRAVLLNPRIPDSLIHAWEKIQEAVKARA